MHTRIAISRDLCRVTVLPGTDKGVNILIFELNISRGFSMRAERGTLFAKHYRRSTCTSLPDGGRWDDLSCWSAGPNVDGTESILYESGDRKVKKLIAGGADYVGTHAVTNTRPRGGGQPWAGLYNLISMRFGLNRVSFEVDFNGDPFWMLQFREGVEKLPVIRLS
jgi:hypothetical protein